MVLILLFILKIAAVAFKTISHPECDGPVLTSTISVFISMSQSLFQRTHSFLSFASFSMALTWVSWALLAGPERPMSEVDQFTAGNTNVLQQGWIFPPGSSTSDHFLISNY